MKTGYVLALELVNLSNELEVLMDEKQRTDDRSQSDILDKRIEIVESEFFEIKNKLKSAYIF